MPRLRYALVYTPMLAGQVPLRPNCFWLFVYSEVEPLTYSLRDYPAADQQPRTVLGRQLGVLSATIIQDAKAHGHGPLAQDQRTCDDAAHWHGLISAANAQYDLEPGVAPAGIAGARGAQRRAGLHGVETARLGVWLTEWARQHRPDLAVFYDHGDPDANPNVAAIKGFIGPELKRATRISEIDLLVANGAGEIVALIEIEERASSPKKVIGTTYAALLSDSFAVRTQGVNRTFRSTDTTRLIVAGVIPEGGHKLPQTANLLGRINRDDAPGRGIRAANVELVFGSQIADVIERLKARIVGELGDPAGVA